MQIHVLFRQRYLLFLFKNTFQQKKNTQLKISVTWSFIVQLFI